MTKVLKCFRCSDPKKTWQMINQLHGKQKRTMKAVFIIVNQRINYHRVIANEFNKYFVSLACKLTGDE